MLQRATIAAASAHQPQLIIADEPTSALDADRADAVLALLRSTGAALLLVSHDINLVARYADRIAVCHQGRIVEIGSVDDVLNKPQAQYTSDLIAAIARTTNKKPLALAPRNAQVLKAVNLSRTYQVRGEMIRAVVSADIELARGEIVGIYGASGCGKSTLLRLLATSELPTSGSVSFGDQLVTSSDRNRVLHKRARSGYVMPIFQDPMSSLDPGWPLWKIVTEPLVAKHRTARPSRSERKEIARAFLNQVGLDEANLEARPNELSVGQCQRVSIARALLAQPAVILADEPTSALDTLTAAKVLRLLVIASEQGTAIVIVSHDRLMLDALCHRVITMREGSLNCAQ
jgi:peptide/nickel transport system ATP-binding protein